MNFEYCVTLNISVTCSTENGRWQIDMDSKKPRHSEASLNTRRSAEEIQQWLIQQIAEELQIRPETISIEQTLMSCGIDSMQVVSIVAKLEDWLGFRFSSNPLDDDPTIRDLSITVAELTADHPQNE